MYIWIIDDKFLSILTWFSIDVFVCASASTSPKLTKLGHQKSKQQCHPGRRVAAASVNHVHSIHYILRTQIPQPFFRPRTDLETSNPRRADSDIIIPESVRVPSVRLPPKVHGRYLRLDAAPLPLRGVRVRHAGLAGQAGDHGPVQPRLDRSVRSEVVLEALPGVCREGLGGRHALRGEIREGGVVGFAIVHEDLVLPADSEVLLLPLGRVGHGDEGHVGVCEGFLCLARKRKKEN